MGRWLRIDRWIVDPLCVIGIAFFLQWFVWWAGMPARPTIPGAAPRFVSEEGFLRFFALFLCLTFGIILGRMIVTSYVPWPTSPPLAESVQRRARGLWRLAFWSLLLTTVGEMVYVRVLAQHPGILSAAVSGGDFAHIGEIVRETKIVGVSSLNNLFLVPTAIYALLAFSKSLDSRSRRRSWRRLVAIGAVALVHSIVLSARMFFVYYLMVVLGTFLLVRRDLGRRLGQYVWLAVIGLVTMVWVGELVRGGWYYAHEHGISVFSYEVQAQVGSRLVQGYIGADFNNAMILLDGPPSMQIGSTSDLFRTIAEKFGRQFYGYEVLPRWSSVFATVNVLGQWWFDAGWLASVFAAGVGIWLGATYEIALRGLDRFWLTPLFYIISFPGIFALTRLNYFGLSIFAIPSAFLFVWFVGASMTRAQREHEAWRILSGSMHAS